MTKLGARQYTMQLGRESAPVRAGLLQVGALQMDTGWGAGVSLTDFGRTLLADVEAAGGELDV